MTTFDVFPKSRMPLSKEYQEIYIRHCLENRKGSTRASGLAGFMERWMHHQVAADLSSRRNPVTLELGAGHLNHLVYEPGVKCYDIVEPFRELVAAAEHQHRVRHFYQDISEIPLTQQYDRILNIAVLEHLESLPWIIARSGLLLKGDGSFRAGIPNEGTFLWRLGYSLTTGMEFRRRFKLDYEILMRYEHVNTAREIEDVLRFFFRRIKVKVFGIHRAVAFYRFFDCRLPDKNRCADFLDSRSQP